MIHENLQDLRALRSQISRSVVAMKLTVARFLLLRLVRTFSDLPRMFSDFCVLLVALYDRHVH